MSLDLAYNGAGHTRSAALAALEAALDPALFGTFKELQTAQSPASDGWSRDFTNGPIVDAVYVDNPDDPRSDGDADPMIRLGLFTETLFSKPYLGGTGAECDFTVALEWLVLCPVTAEAWRKPVFEHGLKIIGNALTPLQLAPPADGFFDIEFGEAEFFQFDVGVARASSFALSLTLKLDAVNPFA
jgi:hypothetical protein